MKNKEVEFKYKAKCTLQQFIEFCKAKSPSDVKLVSGYDHFYSHSKDTSSFYRHRVNTNENQLTFKRKTNEANNYVREEHNIDLPLNVSEEKIKALCNINGYSYNTSIFKNCFIFNYEYYTLVFYVCYDINMNETNRFIEIEMKEDYDWSSEFEAFNELVTLEKLCKILNISAEDRVVSSLFELYRKEL